MTDMTRENRCFDVRPKIVPDRPNRLEPAAAKRRPKSTTASTAPGTKCEKPF
jgi:hypothetical protein